MTPLNETAFEEHIASCLASSRLYNARRSADFDLEHTVDRPMLERFLRAQPKVWEELSHYFSDPTAAVVDEYNRRLSRGESLLNLLRKGFPVKGVPVRLLQFKPTLANNKEAAALYEQNRFSVVRQMYYSTAAHDANNRLDLCILINGIPIITAELKNQATGQTCEHGMAQYRNDRDSANRLLRQCLVHFAVDNTKAFMTTRLAGATTRFLPFNQDVPNPPIEGDYATAYLWQDIWQADSLLDLIENFIKSYTENRQTVVIFPRFHQLRAVRNLRKLAADEGPGHNYLIQHSAGSGKTKSMAWLAHQLANMTNQEGQPIFDSIVMVTDRIVLNRNMADDVLNFETVAGTVKDIRKGSKKLANALNENGRIIISTVQKFAYALPYIKQQEGRKFAIIIDEAHTALGNESAKDIAQALSADTDLDQIDQFKNDTYESDSDAICAYLQHLRRPMKHLSYFAFTATPKDKTFAIFGKDGKTAHDLYSMKQAIEEGFILDVLRYYETGPTLFEYKTKTEEDDEKLFPEKHSKSLINRAVHDDTYVMNRKANLMLERFNKVTRLKIGGRGKAMVVCDSRSSAVKYKRILDAIIHEQYNDAFKTLVAFSGEVKDENGQQSTEASLNDEQAANDDIRALFEKDEYRILIVAEKFQTGFDQPLLHTMFVDKVLGGIQCVQTLSRLNRCCSGKEDTMIVDFRNTAEDVKNAFQPYYTSTELDGKVEPERLYSLKEDIDRYKIFNQDEVEMVVQAVITKQDIETIPSLLCLIVEERVNVLTEDDQELFRKYVDRYVRQYGFLAMFMDFTDIQLEKYYIFLKLLYKFLPYKKDTLPTDILQFIDLSKLRLERAKALNIPLEDEAATLKSARIGDPGKRLEDEQSTLAEILGLVNEPFAGILDENDAVLKQILDELLRDPDVAVAMRARNTRSSLATYLLEKFNDKIVAQMEKYVHLQEVLAKDEPLTLTLIGRLIDYFAQNVNTDFAYDEPALKEKMIEQFTPFFEPLKTQMRHMDEVVDAFFWVLRQQTLDKLDGADDMLKEQLNNLLLNANLSPALRQSYISFVLKNYEAFLKKLYFLIHKAEVPVQTQKEKNAYYPTLIDCILSFKCLKTLEYSADKAKAGYAINLKSLKDWRNKLTHQPLTLTDKEWDDILNQTITMYLYVVAYSITDLEEIEAYDLA